MLCRSLQLLTAEMAGAPVTVDASEAARCSKGASNELQDFAHPLAVHLQHMTPALLPLGAHPRRAEACSLRGLSLDVGRDRNPIFLRPSH